MSGWRNSGIARRVRDQGYDLPMLEFGINGEEERLRREHAARVAQAIEAVLCFALLGERYRERVVSECPCLRFNTPLESLIDQPVA